jgi:hypothetical protein
MSVIDARLDHQHVPPVIGERSAPHHRLAAGSGQPGGGVAAQSEAATRELDDSSVVVVT